MPTIINRWLSDKYEHPGVICEHCLKQASVVLIKPFGGMTQTWICANCLDKATAELQAAVLRDSVEKSAGD